jgi:hypothetical protein
MGRHESAVGWTFSVLDIDAVTTPLPGSPEKELVSLGKEEGRRPSLKACVVETNPGRDRALGQCGWAAALMFSSELRELRGLVRWWVRCSPQEQEERGRAGVGE